MMTIKNAIVVYTVAHGGSIKMRLFFWIVINTSLRLICILLRFLVLQLTFSIAQAARAGTLRLLTLLSWPSASVVDKEQ
jgi:hypothetical protein